MRLFQRECFKIKTKELHDGHTPAVDGKCGFLDCLLPVKAPKPLVTSSVKLVSLSFLDSAALLTTMVDA